MYRVGVAAAVQFGLRVPGGRRSRAQLVNEQNDIKKDRRLTLMNRGNEVGSRRPCRSRCRKVLIAVYALLFL